MKQEGLHDPLQCSPRDRCFTLTTEFETKYVSVACNALIECYRRVDDLSTRNRQNLENTCFGCNMQVHCNIQSKRDEEVDRKTYNLGKGARLVMSEEFSCTSLSEMKSLVKKWNLFSVWLEKNKIAEIRWFTSAYEQRYWDVGIHGVVIETNASKSFNSRLKYCQSNVMSSGRWMYVGKLVQFVEKRDGDDARNVLCRSRIQFQSKTGCKRPSRKIKRALMWFSSLIRKMIVHPCSMIEPGWPFQHGQMFKGGSSRVLDKWYS